MHRVLDGEVGGEIPKLCVPGVEDSNGSATDGRNKSCFTRLHLGEAVAQANEGDRLTTDPELQKGRIGSIKVVSDHLSREDEQLLRMGVSG